MFLNPFPGWTGFMADAAPRAWTDEEVALLGTMSDDEVARKTKRDRLAVIAKRLREGIETAKPVGKPPAKPTTKLGAAIRKARGDRRVSEMAAVAGLSVRYWHYLERQGKALPVDTAKRVAEALKIDPAELLGLE